MLDEEKNNQFKLGIYFDKDQLWDYFINPDYYDAYNSLISKLFTHGIEAKILLYNEKENKYITFDNYKNSSPRILGKLDFNLIWVRGQGFPYPQGAKTLNSKEFIELCDDKEKTREVLGEFMSDRYDVLDEAPPSGKVVIKPRNGRKGQGVIITSGGNIRYNPDTEFAEEFIDSSKGIPGIVEGTHDLRTICVGGEIIYVMVRTPPENSEICNVSQGGNYEIYEKYEFLRKLNNGDGNAFLSRVLVVMEELSNREYIDDSSFYSIDLVKDSISTDYKLLELNSYPGIRPEYPKLIDALANEISKRLKDGK